MQQKDNFDYIGALGALYFKEPENRFYQNLRKWHEEKNFFTLRQRDAIFDDYQEKINGGSSAPASDNEQRPQREAAPAANQTCTPQPHEHTKDTAPICDIYKTWKNGSVPAVELIKQQPSIEAFIKTFFTSPEYGTREKITDPEIIKAIVSLVKDRSVADRSHYHGYNSKLEANYQKTTLEFKENQLFKNGTPLECRLDDAQFDGMRINNCKDYITILLDFYHPEEGYSKKCVIFDVSGGICRESNASNRCASTAETAKRSFMLTDTRDREIDELLRVFGEITEIDAHMLYERSKVSSKEYQKLLDWLNTPMSEEETQQQEPEEQEANDEDSAPTETSAELNQEEKIPEKEQKRLF